MEIGDNICRLDACFLAFDTLQNTGLSGLSGRVYRVGFSSLPASLDKILQVKAAVNFPSIEWRFCVTRN
jgi:hypothetical protein